MAEFKSFYKTVEGNEGQKCHYSTRLDTYGCGCAHDCNYCYAKSLLDFRDLWDAADKGNERAKLALDMFTYQVKKYIGSYIATLNGTDAIVFTAGIGENDYEVRRRVIQGLENLGIEIDVEKNKVKGKQVDITGANSKVKVLVIPTNEELMIAKETMALVK